MHKLLNETIEQKLQEFGGNSAVKLFYDPKSGVGVAEAIAQYVSMEDFIDAFKQASGMIGTHGLSGFIFDKRSLRAFHQPSMEWYFVQWKPQVRKLGLTNHYKILPDEDWFKKCVEAGRDDIKESYGEGFLEGITVEYADSVREAFTRHFKQKAVRP